VSENNLPDSTKRRWSLYSKPLAGEVERIVKPVYKQQGFNEHRILTHWGEVVGKVLARNSVPRKLTFPKGKREQGVLHVEVSSGAHALELQHMQPIILERIATYFGYNAIDKIVFHQNSTSHSPKPRKPKVPSALPDPDFIKAVELCEDEALRVALTALGSAISSNQQG